MSDRAGVRLEGLDTATAKPPPRRPVTSAPADPTVDLHGQITLFGYPSTDARARVRTRPRSWRLAGAIRRAATGVALAPFVGLIPPHAPWIVGSLGIGTILARRRWQERFTLNAVDGLCPRCQAPMSVRPGRLRSPHPLTCDHCHHESSLELPAKALDSVAAD
jgi:hypothetical protein